MFQENNQYAKSFTSLKSKDLGKYDKNPNIDMN